MKTDKAKNGRRAWTKAEDNTLRKLYATTSIKELAAKLNRPVGSICSRVDRLCLVKPQIGMDDNRLGDILHPHPGVTLHLSKRCGR